MAETDLRSPWLVAAWPGMGGVAIIAATHLARTLGADAVEEMPPGDHFDLTQIRVKDGLALPGRLPRSVFHAWRSPPGGGHDLLVFLGEAQPASRGYAYGLELVDHAVARGATRVVTFAAMASPMLPAATPRVFAVSNRPELVQGLGDHGIELLPDGDVSGMNGVLVAAASARGLEALCLLGEFPYFATGLPNPKSSAAVLRAFGSLAGIAVDVGDLVAQGREMEARLGDVLQRLQQAAAAQAGAAPGEELELPAPEEEEPEAVATPRLEPADAARVERLFAEAAADRQQALALKAELDRLGVFKEYEDRFLDLFKSGG